MSSNVLGYYWMTHITPYWKEYIEDTIRTKCINGTYVRPLPKSCAELVQRIYELTPIVMNEYGIDLECTDEQTSFGDIVPEKILEGQKEEFFTRSPYSFEIPCVPHSNVLVEYDEEPIVKPGCDFKVRLRIRNYLETYYYHEVTVGLPEGWTADYSRTCYVRQQSSPYNDAAIWERTVHVRENVAPVNRISVMMSSRLCVVPVAVPITLLG